MFGPASCLPDRCFCEPIQSGLIAQPDSAFSALAFIIVAIAVASSARSMPKEGNRRFGRFYALLLALTGLGTFYYHARLDFLGQTLDVLGMYLLITALLWRRIAPNFLSSFDAARSYLVVNIALLWPLITYPVARRYIFGAFVFALLVIELRRAFRSGWNENWGLFLAVTMFVIGFAVWIPGAMGVCGTEALSEASVNGHAKWHVFSAVSAGLIYLHIIGYRYRLGPSINGTWKNVDETPDAG